MTCSLQHYPGASLRLLTHPDGGATPEHGTIATAGNRSRQVHQPVPGWMPNPAPSCKSPLARLQARARAYRYVHGNGWHVTIRVLVHSWSLILLVRPGVIAVPTWSKKTGVWWLRSLTTLQGCS